MGFRLAVVGHQRSIQEIEKIATDHFAHMEVLGISLSGEGELKSAAGMLAKAMPHLDGILYTRQDPYRMMIGRVDHGALPVRYGDIDGASLIACLMQAAYHQHLDIRRITVDTLSQATVIQAYRALSIPMEETQIHLIAVDIGEEHYVENLADLHRRHYRSGQCDLCLTNVRSVYDILTMESIPCQLMRPTAEAYLYEIRRLTLGRQKDQAPKHRVAMVHIAAHHAHEPYAQCPSFLLDVMEEGHLMEIIAIYAHRVGGAFLPMGGGQYAILCETRHLSEEGDDLSALGLMEDILGKTAFAISMGIGVGKNHQQAQAFARLGKQRALGDGGNRAYIVYGPGEVVGPIAPMADKQKDSASFDPRLSHIADAAGLSIHTILKADLFIQERKDRDFITSELAQGLCVSIRTANRIITKLERKGFLGEVGRMTTGEKGRPTRIFRAMW